MKLVKLPDGTWLDCSLVTAIKIDDALGLLPSGSASTTYSFVSLRGEGGALLLEFKCANRAHATEVSDSLAATINAGRCGFLNNVELLKAEVRLEGSEESPEQKRIGLLEDTLNEIRHATSCTSWQMEMIDAVLT